MNLTGKLFGLSLLFVVGCTDNVVGGGGRDMSRPKDMELVFDDIAPPDLRPTDPTVCGDYDPTCLDHSIGPDNGSPFPLDSDPMNDPNATNDGVGRDPNGYLKLDQTKAAFNYLWIANSEQGTTSKINSKTLKEVARYSTVTCYSLPGGSEAACDGTKGCCSMDDYVRWQARKNNQPQSPHQAVQLGSNYPSRTAVDVNGDLFISNRAFGGQASVTKVSNSSASCIDRNKNGRIDTSSDKNNDGIIDVNDPNEFFGPKDECVLWTTNSLSRGHIGRPMGLGPGAVDNGPSDVWAGAYSESYFVRIDGTSGQIKAETPFIGNDRNSYGLAVDSTGVAWVGPLGGSRLCYFDTKKPQNVGCARGNTSGYGITLDRDQNVWIGSQVARYSPNRANGWATIGLGYWTYISGVSGIGIAADSRNAKKYFVWSCNGGGRILRIPASDIPVPKIGDTNVAPNNWLGINANCYGVGVDNEQNVWAIPQASTITRAIIDANGDMPNPPAQGNPAPNTVCPAGDMCNLQTGHYTYSDFTGFGLRNFTRPSGTYSYIFPGCTDGQNGSATSWQTIVYDAEVPPNTQLTVKARSGSTSKPDNTWGQWTAEFDASPVDLQTGRVLVPNGPDNDNAYYMQVEFTLKTNDRTATPRLKNLAVGFKCNKIQ